MRQMKEKPDKKSIGHLVTDAFNTFINKTDASVSDVLTYHKPVQSL